MSTSNETPSLASWETPDLDAEVASSADEWHEPLAASLDHLPMVPLTAPGMPPPGPDFVRMATALGDPKPRVARIGGTAVVQAVGPELTRLYSQALYGRQSLSVRTPLGYRTAGLLPGHLWGANQATGPRRAEVMVIGSQPTFQEVCRGSHFHPSLRTGHFISELLRTRFGPNAKWHLFEQEWRGWYVTNVVKFADPTERPTQVPANWVHDCLPLLHMELRLVQPRYILCVGSLASKALFGKGLAETSGRALDYPIIQHESWLDVPDYYHADVVTCPDPAAARHNPGVEDDIVNALRKIAREFGVEAPDEDDRHLVEVGVALELVERPVVCPLSCRPARPEDRELLLPTLVESWRQPGRGDSTTRCANYLNRFFQETPFRRPGASYVASVGDTPVGAVLVEEGGTWPWLDLAFVHPAWQRRGVARALLSLAMRSLLGRGHTQILTSYYEDDLAIGAALKWLGFRPDIAPRPPGQ